MMDTSKVQTAHFISCFKFQWDEFLFHVSCFSFQVSNFKFQLASFKFYFTWTSAFSSRSLVAQMKQGYDVSWQSNNINSHFKPLATVILYNTDQKNMPLIGTLLPVSCNKTNEIWLPVSWETNTIIIIIIITRLVTRHISIAYEAMNRMRGWSSLVVTQPSTSHHLLCVQCVRVNICVCTALPGRLFIKAAHLGNMVSFYQLSPLTSQVIVNSAMSHTDHLNPSVPEIRIFFQTAVTHCL